MEDTLYSKDTVNQTSQIICLLNVKYSPLEIRYLSLNYDMNDYEIWLTTTFKDAVLVELESMFGRIKKEL